MIRIVIEMQVSTGAWVFVKSLDNDNPQYVMSQMESVQQVYKCRVRAKQDGKLLDLLG